MTDTHSDPPYGYTAHMRRVGLLLPCNVCVWEEENGSVVSIARPQAMFDLGGNAALQPVVDDADQRLRRALDAVKTRKAT